MKYDKRHHSVLYLLKPKMRRKGKLWECEGSNSMMHGLTMYSAYRGWLLIQRFRYMSFESEKVSLEKDKRR
jgi:hypothetical protein